MTGIKFPNFPCMLFVIFLLLFLIFNSALNFCQFCYCVSWCVPPWVYPAWEPLCFLDLDDNFLSHVQEVFSFLFFKYFLRAFLSSPSGTPIMQMLVCLMLSQRSLRLSAFLFILFSVFCSVAVISTLCPPGRLAVPLPQLFSYCFLLVYYSSLFVLVGLW